MSSKEMFHATCLDGALENLQILEQLISAISVISVINDSGDQVPLQLLSAVQDVLAHATEKVRLVCSDKIHAMSNAEGH